MRKITIAALLAFGLSLGAPAFADSHEEPGNLADVWMMHIKPDMGNEFEEAFKKHLKFRQSKGDARTWNVYTPAIGDKLGYYAVRACCVKWEDLDSYTKWNDDNGVSDNWNDNVDQYVAKYQHYLSEIDLENSNWPEDASDVTLVGVTRYYQKPGMGGALAAAKKKMSTLAKEHGWSRNWSWGDQVGGKDILMLATPYKNYAEMAPMEQSFMAFLTEKMGSEDDAMELMGQFTSAYSHSTYTVYRHRKDMSMEGM